MVTASDALERLRQGNRRFVARDAPGAYPTVSRREELALSQHPFAAVLGCSDSRVPTEAVFDQGVGDLFVVRVAGNVATPTQVASLEFAVDQLGVRLLVVLGHTGCGAVAATLQAVREPDGAAPLGRIGTLVEEIRPAVEAAIGGTWRSDDELTMRAIHANVSRAASRLRADSPLMTEALRRGDVQVVEAVYDLRTGVVGFRNGGESDTSL